MYRVARAQKMFPLESVYRWLCLIYSYVYMICYIFCFVEKIPFCFCFSFCFMSTPASQLTILVEQVPCFYYIMNVILDMFICLPLRADVNSDGLLELSELTTYISAKIKEHLTLALKENFFMFTAIDLKPRNGKSLSTFLASLCS